MQTLLVLLIEKGVEFKLGEVNNLQASYLTTLCKCCNILSSAVLWINCLFPLIECKRVSLIEFTFKLLWKEQLRSRGMHPVLSLDCVFLLHIFDGKVYSVCWIRMASGCEKFSVSFSQTQPIKLWFPLWKRLRIRLRLRRAKLHVGIAIPLSRLFVMENFLLSGGWMRNMMWKALVLLSMVMSSSCIGEPPLETVKQWNHVTFDFPYDWPVKDKDLFNPEQIVTTGLEIGSNRIFLATPRLFSGVPATISSVSRDTVGDSPVLKVREKQTNAKVRSNANSQHFRLFPTGLIMKLDRNSTTVASLAWFRCTDWRLTRAIGCGRSTLACRDLSKTSKLRALPKFSSMIWIQIRSFEGSCLPFSSLIWLSVFSNQKRWENGEANQTFTSDCNSLFFFLSLVFHTIPPEILLRIDFPKEVIRKESLFTNIIVDETTSRPENHCDDAVVYISDTVEPGN